MIEFLVVLTAIVIGLQIFTIIREIKTMASLQDLDTALDALSSQQAQLATDVTALITDVEALIAQLKQGGDFSSQVAKVTADIAQINTVDTAVTGEDTNIKGGN